MSITQPIFKIIGLGRQLCIKNLYTEFHENSKDGVVIDRQADRMTDRCGPHTRHSFSPSKERVNCTGTIRVSNSRSDRSYLCFSICPKRSGAQRPFFPLCTYVIPREQRDQEVNSIVYLPPAPRWRMSGAARLLLLYAFMDWRKETLLFLLFAPIISFNVILLYNFIFIYFMGFSHQFLLK